MTAVRLAREFVDGGVQPSELARLTRTQQLLRVRRGAYVDYPAEAEPREQHLQLLEATLRQSSPESIASHMSAAAVHGLPLWPQELTRAHLTRDRRGGHKLRRYSEIRGLPLGAEEVVVVGGVRVTSLARTVVDLSCSLPMTQAVAIGDAARRRGLGVDELAQSLEAVGQRRRISRARRAIAFLDPLSESPAESVSRVEFSRLNVPPTHLQFEVHDASGKLIGRCDFAWEDRRTVGECDGKIKYGRALRPGQDLEEVLFEEKRREDALRDAGFEVVRWVWADLYPADRLRERLDRAFARGRQRAV